MARFKVKVSEGQTIFDVSLQCTGGISAIFSIAEQNGFDVNVPLHTGQVLVFDADVEDRAVADHYTRNAYRPANAPTFEELSSMPSDFHYPDFHEVDFNAS